MSDAYDPQAVDDKPASSQYVTKKDIKVVVIVLCVLAVIAYPVYIYMLGGVKKSTCSKHLSAVGKALSAYMEDHDGRYPYAYQTADYTSDLPAIRPDGLMYTWQWDLRPYNNDNSIFSCPAALPEENNLSSPDGKEMLRSSYGMLFAYSGLSGESVNDPKSQLMIGETSDMGANGTADPIPLVGYDGTKAKSDGFLIGFDNSNTYPDAKTTFPTRLSYGESAKKGFTDETQTRHPGGNHFLYADSHLSKSMDATVARITQAASGLGVWNVPKRAIRR